MDRNSSTNGLATAGATPLLQIRLLGGFAVRVGGSAVPSSLWRQRRAAAIVKLLALEPAHRLHREQLIEEIWPDLDPESAANNLRVSLHHARRGLEAAGAPPETVLVRDGETVLLGPPESIWVDVEAFGEGVLRAWQSSDPTHAERTLGLYAGDLLPEDPYEDWAASRRESLRSGYLTLLTRLAGLHEQGGRLGEAILAYERLLAAEPLDEGAHAAVMRLHARMGHRELALAQFARLTALLDRELGAEPERATRELAAAIREGRFVSDSPPPSPPPAPSVAPIPVSRLPAAVDVLIGRERELAELTRLLGSSRLVTLTGPGGIGKTRLALEGARLLTDRYPDGVVFVDSSSLRDPALLLPTVAHALAVDETGDRPIAEALAAAIAERRMLLVLDNLEQIVAAAESIGALLAVSPQLTVLATSRIRLRLRGEQVYLVAPLAYPEAVETGGCHGVAGFSESPAVELFRRRAQAVRPEFDLTAENIAAVVAICRRLDGLPLAIELAAAWVRVLSPDQLLRRLAQPLDALGTAARDVPRRQRTLRDTIAWSHDLLAPQERTLFRRLSVFVGGCTIEGVEAIAAGTEGDALETVAALVDHSLLSTRPGVDGPSSRYAMLETIREFAAEQLEASGEHTDVHAAFEAHLLDLAERAESGLRGSEQLRWLDRLEEEHANVRAVLGTALDRGNGEVALALAPRLWLFWRTRGYSAEGHTWLERVLEASPRAAPAQSAVARFALGKLSVDLGDYAGADRHFRVSADLWRDTGNDELLAGALSALTTVKLNVGELDEAEVLGQEALAISRQFGDEINIATALLNLGMIARVGGRADRALDLLGQSLDIWRQLSDPDAIALTLMNLGMVYHAAGQVARATSLLAECAELYARLGDRFHLGVVAQHLGHIDREARRYEEAMWRYAESLRHFDAVGSSEGVVESVEWIAVTATEHGLARPALRLFGAAAAARDALRLVPLEAERLVVNASKTQALRELGEPAGPEELAAGGALPLALAADEALALANPTAARAAR